MVSLQCDQLVADRGHIDTDQRGRLSWGTVPLTSASKSQTNRPQRRTLAHVNVLFWIGRTLWTEPRWIRGRVSRVKQEWPQWLLLRKFQIKCFWLSVAHDYLCRDQQQQANYACQVWPPPFFFHMCKSYSQALFDTLLFYYLFIYILKQQTFSKTCDALESGTKYRNYSETLL